MTNEHGGLFPGSTPHDRAVAVAGFLAERGIQSLTINSSAAGDSVTVTARATDLPAVLSSRESWALEAAGVRIQGTRSEARWTTADPAMAHTLRTIRPMGC